MHHLPPIFFLYKYILFSFKQCIRYCHPLFWNNVLRGIHSKIIYDDLLTIYIVAITFQQIILIYSQYNIPFIRYRMYNHPLLWNNVLSGIHTRKYMMITYNLHFNYTTSQHPLPLEHSVYLQSLSSHLTVSRRTSPTHVNYTLYPVIRKIVLLDL